MAISPIVNANTQVDPQFWLNAAHGAVRNYCGWHVAPVVTETITLDGSGGRTLLLPSKRVVSLLSVQSDGVDVTDAVSVSKRAGMIEIDGVWSCKLAGIEVEVEHGFSAEEVPDVAGLIVTLTKRARDAGRTIAAQAVGAANVRYITSSDGAVPGIPLLAQEKELLDRYRLNWGP